MRPKDPDYAAARAAARAALGLELDAEIIGWVGRFSAQKDPQTLVAHPDDGVSTLADAKGRPIMVGKFSQQEFWQFLKQKFGSPGR